MGLVVIAGAATLLVAALLIARPAFRSHLDRAEPPMSAQTQSYVDEAFASAVLFALSVGVIVALVVALVVTWLVAKRVAAPVAEAAEAAQRIADGDYETRLPQPSLGPEFERLTFGFNTMARRLADTEQTRRRLLGDLAHELRTPLASMQATIEAVTDGILPSDEATLATLTEQSQRLHRLVGDLSAVSRAEERQLNLNPVLVPLQDVVSGAVAAARPRFDAKGITLTADDRVTAVRVLVDPDRLAERLPALRLLTRSETAIAATARRVMPAVAALLSNFSAALAPCRSQIGSGALPVDLLASHAMTFAGPGLEAAAARLRGLAMPVIGRIGQDRLWLDCRCLEAEREQDFLANLR